VRWDGSKGPGNRWEGHKDTGKVKADPSVKGRPDAGREDTGEVSVDGHALRYAALGDHVRHH